MDSDFQLPVTFNGKQLYFTSRLLNYGYVVKIEVDVDDTKVLFEPDESREWRALISYEEAVAHKKIDAELLQAIALGIEAVLR